MIKAVLDTNMIVSAHLVAQGRQALILELALGGAFEWIASEALLEEYEDVLRRPRFGFSPAAITQSMETIRDAVRLVTPRNRYAISSDPDDNLVLECAVEGNADFLVTGNLRHSPARFRGVRVVSPRTFQLILASALDS